MKLNSKNAQFSFHSTNSLLLWGSTYKLEPTFKALWIWDMMSNWQFRHKFEGVKYNFRMSEDMSFKYIIFLQNICPKLFV